MKARTTVVAYCEAVHDLDLDRLLSLFAPDAVVAHPVGVYEGMAAIEGFYRDLVFAGQAQLKVGRLLTDDTGTIAMVELVGSSPLDDHERTVHALDVFDTDPATGLITVLTVYAR